jgi:hypothetical protein
MPHEALKGADEGTFSQPVTITLMMVITEITTHHPL